jgi:hypothetical protein
MKSGISIAIDIQNETLIGGYMLKQFTEEYKSDISLDLFANKLYIDPQYGNFQPKATINYSVLKGKWEIEDVREDNSIKLINKDSADHIILSFNSLKDKVDFLKGIYAEHPVKQVGNGMKLQELANSNLRPRIENYIDNLIRKILSPKEHILTN